MKELILLKVTEVKKAAQFAIIGFLIMDSDFKILYAMSSVNISDIAIITVKNVDYRCIIHKISKSEAIILLESSVLEDCGYI